MMIGSDVPASDERIWTTMIREADTNGDGEIDYGEFTRMMYNCKDAPIVPSAPAAPTPPPAAAKPAPRK
jgi:hypothetical protein